MTREEQIVKASKDAEKQMGFGEGVISSYGIGFIGGAVWADEHPDLYSVTRKAVEKEREYLIDKAWELLENIFHDRSHHSGRGDAGEIVTYDFDSMQEFELKFRKAMEEQQ